MEKYKKYIGVIIFAFALLSLFYGAYKVIYPAVTRLNDLKLELENKQRELDSQRTKLDVVQKRIKRIKNAIMTSQKKIYYPIESDLGNETLFFTLYNDVIEMLHANSIKIRDIDYTYNPEDDEFVKFGKDIYFVCDIDMDLVSNYVNLGKLIQDLYQYPYYIRLNYLDVKPYDKDKKILLIKMGLRLYAHTSPESTITGGASNININNY